MTSSEPDSSPKPPPAGQSVGSDAERTSVAICCETRGAQLVAPVDFDLRGACIKCGAREGLKARKTSLFYTPTWIHITAVGCIAWVVLYFMFRKRSSHALELCGSCAQRWRFSRLAQWPVALLCGGATLTAFVAIPALGSLPLIVTVPTVIVALLAPYVLIGRVRLGVARIDDDYVHLIGASRGFVHAMGVPRSDGA